MEPSIRKMSLRAKTISAQRYLSLEQAGLITGVYNDNEDAPIILKRALALERSLSEISISIDPEIEKISFFMNLQSEVLFLPAESLSSRRNS